MTSYVEKVRLAFKNRLASCDGTGHGTPGEVPPPTYRGNHMNSVPISTFDANPRAYALVSEALALRDGHQKLLLLWLAQNRPEAFSLGLELVLGLETP